MCHHIWKCDLFIMLTFAFHLKAENFNFCLAMACAAAAIIDAISKQITILYFISFPDNKQKYIDLIRW